MDLVPKFIIIFASYLLGSIPFGLLIAKRLRGIDIRLEGSGNIGATNVYRVVGPAAGLAVFTLDLLKGAVPCWVMLMVNPDKTWAMVAGLAAIIGHRLSVFLKFKGGKSVATSFGILIGIAPEVGGIAIGIFVVVVALTRKVSLGSIIGAASVPVFLVLFHYPTPVIGLISLAVLLIIFRHLGNIKRLLNGTEPSFGVKKDK
ncbi:MAG: glycerol-3-phosphate 1-O-acyltransferase PlsY [bacterium]